MIFEPDMFAVEIAITYVCNVRCHNCLVLSTQAPTKRSEDMTLDQVKTFVAESVACWYPWSWIKVYGGEPTLHPQFLDICGELARYKTKRPSVRLSVVSNDTRPDLVAKAMELGFDPMTYAKVRDNTDRDGNPILYVPVNNSPKDAGQPAWAGCWIPEHCGIALNNLGFWPCSPSAAAARVWGYEAPVKHVWNLSAEKLKTVYKHCEHCGFAMMQDKKYEQITSPSWAQKLRDYKA